MSKLSARRLDKRRKKQTKEFDQARRELGSTVFENRRDSIQTVSFLRIKAREDMENVIMKNFNYRDEVVRSRRNIPAIILSRVGSEEFSFRERRDSCAAIWLK